VDTSASHVAASTKRNNLEDFRLAMQANPGVVVLKDITKK